MVLKGNFSVTEHSKRRCRTLSGVATYVHRYGNGLNSRSIKGILTSSGVGDGEVEGESV